MSHIHTHTAQLPNIKFNKIARRLCPWYRRTDVQTRGNARRPNVWNVVVDPQIMYQVTCVCVCVRACRRLRGARTVAAAVYVWMIQQPPPEHRPNARGTFDRLTVPLCYTSVRSSPPYLAISWRRAASWSKPAASSTNTNRGMSSHHFATDVTQWRGLPYTNFQSKRR